MNTFVLTIVIICYLLITGYLGFYGYRKTKTATDYLLAGRKQHPMIMALSYGATFISTSAIIGFGGAAGLFGLGLLWLTFLNIFMGIFIAFVFFGRRTRRMGHNLDAHTFPELLGKRFNSRSIQITAGLIIFVFMPLYAAATFLGAVKAIDKFFPGFNYDTALIIFAIIVAAYVLAGGLKGVMYTDAFQGGLMFVGMLILLIITYIKLGGVTQAHQTLSGMANLVPEKLAAGGHQGWTMMPKSGSPMWWTLVSTIVMGVGIGVLAQPQLIVRFMTVKSDKELNRGVMVGGIFILCMTGIAFIVGSLTNAYFYNNPEFGKIALAMAPKGDVDYIMPTYIKSAFPVWFIYVFLITLMAAAMSTLSSQYHTMGTALGRDVIETAVKKKREVKQSVLITRFGVIVGILVTVAIGRLAPEGYIAIATSIFFGLCASCFLPMYFGSLYTKRITRAGAITGMLCGFLTTAIWYIFFHQKEAVIIKLCKFITGKDVLAGHPWNVIDPLIIALPVSIITTFVISAITKPVDNEHLKKCFKGIKNI